MPVQILVHTALECNCSLYSCVASPNCELQKLMALLHRELWHSAARDTSAAVTQGPQAITLCNSRMAEVLDLLERLVVSILLFCKEEEVCLIHYSP